MRNLAINLETFGFIERERLSDGKIKIFRCGRDFLYYAFNYYYPEKFNPEINNPEKLEQSHAFGLPIPFWLYFTSLQFIYVPKFLAENNLKLLINDKQINSFFDFFIAMAKPIKISVVERIKQIENAIDNNFVSGINFSFGLRNRFF